jgi:heme/copper-type cytochrome/quinol oxidase subunit 2
MQFLITVLIVSIIVFIMLVSTIRDQQSILKDNPSNKGLRILGYVIACGTLVFIIATVVLTIEYGRLSDICPL